MPAITNPVISVISAPLVATVSVSQALTFVTDQTFVNGTANWTGVQVRIQEANDPLIATATVPGACAWVMWSNGSLTLRDDTGAYQTANLWPGVYGGEVGNVEYVRKPGVRVRVLPER